jgi:hypothetical protein
MNRREVVTLTRMKWRKLIVLIGGPCLAMDSGGEEKRQDNR